MKSLMFCAGLALLAVLVSCSGVVPADEAVAPEAVVPEAGTTVPQDTADESDSGTGGTANSGFGGDMDPEVTIPVRGPAVDPCAGATKPIVRIKSLEPSDTVDEGSSLKVRLSVDCQPVTTLVGGVIIDDTALPDAQELHAFSIFRDRGSENYAASYMVFDDGTDDARSIVVWVNSYFDEYTANASRLTVRVNQQ